MGHLPARTTDDLQPMVVLHRLGTMLGELLGELHRGELDAPARERLRRIYFASLAEAGPVYRPPQPES